MEWIEIFKTIILGIVEGITEWLPISSTGHLILMDEFLKLDVSAEFKEMFDVVIQLGAIMAVVVLYFQKLWPFTTKQKGYVKKDTMSLWFKVLVASMPAAIIGIPFDDKIDKLFFNAPTVAITLILYGVLFIVIENYNKNKKFAVTNFNQLTYKHVAIIGIFQVLAIIPGTSRSGATIVGAMLIGISRYVAAEFSFYLAIPAMFGASLLKLRKFGFDFAANEVIALVTGMIVAFIVSIIAIRFLMGYIKKKDFKVFGYYRIVLGILVILYFLVG